MTADPHADCRPPVHRALDVRPLVMDPAAIGGRPVTHDHGGYVFVEAGRLRFWMGAAWRVGPGDVLLVPAGRPHYALEVDGVRGLGMAVCAGCLGEGRAGRILGDALDGVWRGDAPVRRLRPEGRPRIDWALGALREELAGDATAPGRPLAIDGLLAVIAAEVQRAGVAPAEGSAVGHSLVADALGCIRERATEGLSLTDVARAVGRSPTHLAAVVKAETGRTVVQWITTVRMARARQLLLHSDETIDAIADRIGFGSPSHFHRTFRRQHGTPPGGWRALHRARSAR